MIAVRLPVRLERVRRLVPGVVGAIALAVLLGTDDGLVLCPYRRCTGGDCPLCGTTRSAARLLRGDAIASWQAHPLVVLLAAQTPLWLAIDHWASRRSAQTWWQRNGQKVLLANVALATVLWIIRLATADIARPATLTLPW